MKKFAFLLLLGIISSSISIVEAKAQGVVVTEICLPSSSGCVPVNANTPFPITTNNPAAVPTTNASQTIAIGNTFQQALGINTQRRSLTIINNNTNGHNCFVYIGGGAASVSNSILLTPSAQYFRNSGYIPQDPIQVTCTGASDTVYVDYE